MKNKFFTLSIKKFMLYNCGTYVYIVVYGLTLVLTIYICAFDPVAQLVEQLTFNQ